MLFTVAGSGIDDDRLAAGHGAPPPSAEEFAEDLQTVLDHTQLTEAAPERSSGEDVELDGPSAAAPVHGDPRYMAPGPVAVRALPPLALPRAAAVTGSPVDARKLDEVARTRRLIHIVLALAASELAAALITRGDPAAKVVAVIGAVAAALGGLVALALTRDPARYDAKQLAVPAVPIVFGALAGVYYWGVGSPVAGLMVYGLYAFSAVADRRATTRMYAAVALGHGGLGLGIITGALVDRGVLRIDSLRARDQLAILVLIEVLYAVAHYTARVTQRTTLDALAKLEQATRGAGERDASLAEAHAELDRALKIGSPGRFTHQIIGSFRLGVLIGRGDLGEVYEAHGIADPRLAAVKLFGPGSFAEPLGQNRFLHDAHIASRLDSPHIVRVLEVGTALGELPFVAMERLYGADLAQQLRHYRHLSLPQTKVLVDQLAIGLEAGRVAGIVHRDLKPHNVLFAEQAGLRRWKILDFGIAASGGAASHGGPVGTPAYMAPEQARGEDVDHRADVYSLAAIIYRAITGHPVVLGDAGPATLHDVVYRVATRPSLLAQLPADVDRVVAIGLAKDPRERFAFALELARWFSAAVTQGLDPDQRRRADDLIARYPWGARAGS